MKNDENFAGVTVIRCPRCQEYIGLEAEECKYCFSSITPEMRSQAVQAEKSENSIYRAASYRNQIGGGITAFVIGAVLIWLASPHESGDEYVFYPKALIVGVILLFGGALVALGFGYFWLQEKRGRG